jgi:uncharacterized protein YhfF
MASSVAAPAALDAAITSLSELLGDRLSTAETVRQQHGHDASYHPCAPPDAVAFPESTEEVSEIVKICAQHEVPIIPFGSGSGLEGHVVALGGGVTIDLSRMNKILRVSPGDLAQIIFLRHWCHEHNVWADTAVQPRAATESLVTIPHSIQPFWLEFQATVGGDVQARFYEALHFDDKEPAANELARLVLVGTKRATAGLPWSFEAENRPPPKPGNLSVVTNWQGESLCVIETKSVATVPFEEVSKEFVATEGEGDGSCAIGAKCTGHTSEEYANALEECQARECQSSASSSRSSTMEPHLNRFCFRDINHRRQGHLKDLALTFSGRSF